MKTAKELRMLRRVHGYFSAESIAQEMTKRGVKASKNSYLAKENGKARFSIDDIKVLAEILDLSIEEAVDSFS